MAAKFVLALCATALFAQANSQYLGLGGLRSNLAYDAPCGCGAGLRGIGYDAPYGVGLRGVGYDAPCGIADIAAASSLNAAWGGGLGVTSSSAVPPTGLNVASENVYEGSLAVAGNLPFLGTVAMEGVFPTAGAGAVSYNCGNGAVGITAEGVAPALDIVAPVAAISPAAGLASPLGVGYNGYAGRLGGCGCGAVY